MTMKSYLLIGTVVLALVLLAGGYLYFSNSASLPATTTYPPITTVPKQETIASKTSNQIALTITSPLPGSVVRTNTVTITGTTVPEATVSVNEKNLRADAVGKFNTTVVLEEGENTVIVVAYDDDGNVAEQELILNYEPEE